MYVTMILQQQREEHTLGKTSKVTQPTPTYLPPGVTQEMVRRLDDAEPFHVMLNEHLVTLSPNPVRPRHGYKLQEIPVVPSPQSRRVGRHGAEDGRVTSTERNKGSAGGGKGTSAVS